MNEKELNKLVLGYVRGFDMLYRNAEAFKITGIDDLESIYTMGKEQFFVNFDKLSDEEIKERRKAYDIAFEQFKNEISN